MNDTLPARRLIFCDYLRGIAAVSVFMAHFFYSFFVEGGKQSAFEIVNLNYIEYPFPLISQKFLFDPYFPGFCGVFGVSVFFLISGFVIAYSLERKTFKNFWISRFFRLYPTYFFVMSLNFIIVLVNGIISQKNFPYSFHDLLVNYFMGVPNLLSDTKILDFVGWTLIIELFFYLLISLASIKYKVTLKTIIIIDIACFFIIKLFQAMQFNCINLGFITRCFSLVPFMLIGSILFLHYSKKITSKTFLSALLGQYLFFLTIYYNNAVLINWVSKDLMFYFFTLTIFCFLSFYKFNDDLSLVPILKWLGDISYPLYLVHFYLGFSALWFFLSIKFPLFLAVLITIIIIFLAANFINKYIEMPSNKFGKYIIQGAKK